MSRYATIDIGTNSVLLLVAEHAGGQWNAVVERAELTRLGQGVDKTRTLAADAIERTVEVVARFATEARALGARAIAVTATSAARDAQNGAAFLETVHQRADVTVEILPGDDEARLSFASAFADFGSTRPLVVIDIGGGSTEFIFGDISGAISFRQSFDVGAVRLTERFITSDPPQRAELAAVEEHLDRTFALLPTPEGTARVVGVAGTVTTLFAVATRLEPYDAKVVHGAELSVSQIASITQRLATLPIALRRTLPGLQPKRADVIVAGGLILQRAMSRLGAAALTVSDRGLRWGLLVERFGKQP